LVLVTGQAAEQSAGAAVEVRTELGLHAAVFNVPQGQIRVNVPDDMAAGDTISGTVFAEPAGTAPVAREQNKSELAGYIVDLEPPATSGAKNRFKLRVPGNVSRVRVVLRDRKKRVVTQCDFPVRPTQPAAGAPGPDQFDLPLGGQAGSFLTVRGPFDGEMETTAVNIGGSGATLIAESPRKVVFQSPAGIVGSSRIEVIEGGVTVRNAFQSLGVKAGASKTGLKGGETAMMTAVVSGLKGMKEPAWLIISNRAPNVVLIEGGTVQHISIHPGDVASDGTFRVTRALTGVKSGAFDIFLLATRAPTEQFQMDRTVGQAVDSWSRSNSISVMPEARSLIMSSVQSARDRLDDFLRQQEALRADGPALLDALVRDYCFDLRDRKIRSGGRHADLGRPRKFTSSFAAQADRNVALDATDVRSFSFLQYLASLLARITPSQPLGYIRVSSKPEKQAVIIDNRGGADYFTNRKFVVSTGEHAVRVAACSQTVRVAPYQEAGVACGT
jgi:hypothetical protein